MVLPRSPLVNIKSKPHSREGAKPKLEVDPVSWLLVWMADARRWLGENPSEDVWVQTMPYILVQVFESILITGVRKEVRGRRWVDCLIVSAHYPPCCNYSEKRRVVDGLQGLLYIKSSVEGCRRNCGPSTYAAKNAKLETIFIPRLRATVPLK